MSIYTICVRSCLHRTKRYRQARVITQTKSEAVLRSFERCFIGARCDYPSKKITRLKSDSTRCVCGASNYCRFICRNRVAESRNRVATRKPHGCPKSQESQKSQGLKVSIFIHRSIGISLWSCVGYLGHHLHN